jgi:hypothetical protein
MLLTGAFHEAGGSSVDELTMQTLENVMKFTSRDMLDRQYG